MRPSVRCWPGLVIAIAMAGTPALEGATASGVFVSAEGEGTVAVVDPVSLRTVASIKVGARPHNLAPLGGNLLLVATQGAREISVIDTRARRELRRIRLDAAPHDVWGSADGRRAHVLSAEGLLVVLDGLTWEVLQRQRLGGRPHDLVVFHGSIWITDIGLRSLSIVPDQIDVRPTSLALPVTGHDIAIRPGTNELWVTPWSGNEVAIVDARTRTVAGVIKVGRRPQHPAFSPDGREAWITDTGSPFVHVVDAGRRTVVGTIALGGAPHHVAVDGQRAYVAVSPSLLVVIDARRRAIIERVEVGRDPHDIVIHAVSQ